jgi:hypothetical protein
LGVIFQGLEMPAVLQGGGDVIAYRNLSGFTVIDQQYTACGQRHHRTFIESVQPVVGKTGSPGCLRRGGRLSSDAMGVRVGNVYLVTHGALCRSAKIRMHIRGNRDFGETSFDRIPIRD